MGSANGHGGCLIAGVFGRHGVPASRAWLLPISLVACSDHAAPSAPRSPLAKTAVCAAGKRCAYRTPVHLGPLINGPGYDGGPSLSADGLNLYFVSDRSGALGGPGDQDIYLTRRRSINDDWGVPERVPEPVSSTFFDVTPAISRDGKTLYLGSNRPGPFSPPWPDLWVSHRASVDGPWSEPENLGSGVNTRLFEGSISVSDDALTAYFAGMTTDSVLKIWTSTRHSTTEPFGPRVLLPRPINSDGHAYGPALTPDGKTMFFAAGTENPFAPGARNSIFVSERRSTHSPWGTPIGLDAINCPTCFAGLPTISGDASVICWMGDRGDSYGDKDIYCAQHRHR
jgi:Tol biopolymer transport system component